MKIVLITASDELARRMLQAAGGDVLLLPPSPLPADPEQLLALGIPQQPEVLVLGPDVPLAGALSLAGRFDQSSPGTSVVLVSGDGTHVWLAAMRVGVRDVFAPDADIPDIRQVIDRARTSAIAQRRDVDPAVAVRRVRSRVIVVASPKGGSGKTTVASNLGVGLAGTAPRSTVLVDLDVQFGDIASALQLRPEHCLTDAISGSASQDTMVLKTFLTPHPTGLHVLCGSELPAAADRISAEAVSTLLKQLAAEFPYVVVDTSAGLSEHTLAALDCATDAVLVCGMDVPSARGMRKELLLLNDLNLTPRRHVVLNFAERRGRLSVPDVQNAIGAKASVVLPRSKAIQLSTDQGVPLLQSGTRDPATNELRRLVALFTPTLRAPERRPPAAAPERVPQHRAPSAVST